MELGYTKPLYILPFDHRGSLSQKLFGWEGFLSDQQIKQIAKYKQIVYEGFVNAVNEGVLKENAAILVDEQGGDAILKQAKEQGFIISLPVEKSGQKEFQFEFGDEFASHIIKYKPDFVKALIRYNPEGELDLNKRQQEKLKKLSDFCHANDFKFMLESLVPPTMKQLQTVQMDKKRYNTELRPTLETKMVDELQSFGVEPDVWKIEGCVSPKNYKMIISQIRKGKRKQVGMIILGRGESAAQVEKWLAVGSSIEGVIGFAIGRTVFWQPLLDYKIEKISRQAAVQEISKNYSHFVKIFTQYKNVYRK